MLGVVESILGLDPAKGDGQWVSLAPSCPISGGLSAPHGVCLLGTFPRRFPVNKCLLRKAARLWLMCTRHGPCALIGILQLLWDSR